MSKLLIPSERVSPLAGWLQGSLFVKRLSHYEEGTTTAAKASVSLFASFDIDSRRIVRTTNGHH